MSVQQPARRWPSSPKDREVVLRDPDGAIRAFGWVADDHYWLEFPEVARFQIAADSAAILAFPKSSVRRDLVLDAYHTAALPLALQALGLEALHASAVKVPTGVAAFTAMSGTGKSTVACGMAQRGYALWADDAVVFDARRGDAAVVSYALPFTVKLRDDSRAFLAVDEVPTGAGSQTSAAPSPLAGVVILERSDDGAGAANQPEIERLASPDALVSLLPHGYRFSLNEAARKRETVESYLQLVARVPVFRARFTSGFEHLEELLDAIEQGLRAE